MSISRTKLQHLRLLLAHIHAQILRKYLSIQGERRSGAPAYTQKRFVNAALSKHVRFQSFDEKGNSPEDSEDDEIGGDTDDQLREIYATKSKRPPPKPNKSNLVFPYIEKEVFDALPEDVRLKINQQHAYYWELLPQERASKSKGRNVADKNSSQRSQHITTFVPDNPYDHIRSLMKLYQNVVKMKVKMIPLRIHLTLF